MIAGILISTARNLPSYPLKDMVGERQKYANNLYLSLFVLLTVICIVDKMGCLQNKKIQKSGKYGGGIKQSTPTRKMVLLENG